MKHLLIYLIAAVLIFSYINFFIGSDEMVSDFLPTQLTLAAEAISPSQARTAATTPVQAGVIFSSMGSLDAVYCKNAIIENLGESYSVHVNESCGKADVQKELFDQMVQKGYKLILVELFEDSETDYYISTAQQKDITLVFMGNQPSEEQLSRMDNLYYVGYDSIDPATTLAEASVMMWMTERENLDFDEDDILEYSVISKNGFMETGKQSEFENYLDQIHLNNEIVHDFLTDDINVDLEDGIDKMIIDDSELFVCVESSNAKRLVNYLNDPTEFKKWPKMRIAVMSVDEDARKLVKEGYVSVAVGYDGGQLGAMAAELVKAAVQKEQPDGETLGMRQEGRAFFIAPTTLRAEKVVAGINKPAIQPE